MINLQTAGGKLTLGPKTFIAFQPKARGGQTWQSGLPFRLQLWDGPCQRPFTLEKYEYRLQHQGQRGAASRFRLFIPAAFLRLELEVEPHADGFSLRLFPETLIEERPHQIRLLELELLPDFFRAAYGAPGWFLLPAYTGVLAYFNHQAEMESRAMVYSEQPKWEDYGVMPLCGMKAAKDGWLCILTQGEFDARIVTRSFRNGKSFAYTNCPSFIFRHEKQDHINADLKEARFLYFAGPDADWNQMAVAYRNHVIQARGIRPLRERIRDNSSLAYAASSLHVKIFHGMKTGRLYDGDETMSVTATFAETAAIAREMKKNGVDKCVFFLVGWNPEGHDGMYPSRFPVEPKLGGEAGFRQLRKELDRVGYQLSVHDNHVDAYRRSPFFSSLDLLTDRQGEPIGGSHWGGGATWRVCPATMPNPKSLLDLERMQKLGVNGIYYLDNMPSPIFTCHDPKHPASRRQYAEGIRRLAQSARDLYGCVSAEGYNQYLLETLDMAWHIPPPLRQFIRFREISSFIDELVPFYQVSLHGLLLYHAGYSYSFAKEGLNPAQTIALELALGALPLNEVAFRDDPGFYVPDFRPSLKTMGLQYQAICGKHGDLQTQFINRIAMDAKSQIWETDYEDGRRFRCNLKTGKVEIAKQE